MRMFGGRRAIAKGGGTVTGASGSQRKLCPHPAAPEVVQPRPPASRHRFVDAGVIVGAPDAILAVLDAFAPSPGEPSQSYWSRVYLVLKGVEFVPQTTSSSRARLRSTRVKVGVDDRSEVVVSLSDRLPEQVVRSRAQVRRQWWSELWEEVRTAFDTAFDSDSDGNHPHTHSVSTNEAQTDQGDHKSDPAVRRRRLQLGEKESVEPRLRAPEEAPEEQGPDEEAFGRRSLVGRRTVARGESGIEVLETGSRPPLVHFNGAFDGRKLAYMLHLALESDGRIAVALPNLAVICLGITFILYGCGTSMRHFGTCFWRSGCATRRSLGVDRRRTASNVDPDALRGFSPQSSPKLHPASDPHGASDHVILDTRPARSQKLRSTPPRPPHLRLPYDDAGDVTHVFVSSDVAQSTATRVRRLAGCDPQSPAIAQP